MLEVLFQTFSQIIDHMTRIVNFFYEIGEILIFVMLPINWLKIWNEIYSILLSQIQLLNFKARLSIFCFTLM